MHRSRKRKCKVVKEMKARKGEGLDMCGVASMIE